MTDNVIKIFKDVTIKVKRLKKEQYVMYFDEFKNNNVDFFEDLANQLENNADKENEAKAIGENFAISVQDVFKNDKDKIPGTLQTDLNFFMIYYVFPLILQIDSSSNKLLLNNIVASWRKQFKDSDISYTTYDILCKNFRAKIFGIF